MGGGSGLLGGKWSGGGVLLAAALGTSCGTADDPVPLERTTATGGSADAASGGTTSGGAPAGNLGGTSGCAAFVDWASCNDQNLAVLPGSDAAEAPCALQLAEEPPALFEINVVVDCEVIPLARPGGAGGEENGWSIDTETSPPTVRMNSTLCAQIERRFDRIDVVLGCRGPQSGEN